MAFIRIHKSAITAAAAIAAFYLVLLLLGVTCPIKFLTGVSCAGCGMTRAWLSLIHLDPVGAMEFHPLFWTIPIVGVAFVLKNRFPKFFKAVACVTVGLFIAVYILRMLDPDCSVVVFEPKNNLFYRIVSFLNE